MKREHTWRAAAFEIHDGIKQGVLFSASYDVSFAFPQSTTKTTSLMVILVSAILVARTIFRTPSSGLSNINLWTWITEKGSENIVIMHKPEKFFKYLYSLHKSWEKIKSK